MNASVAQALSRYFPDPVSSFRPLAGRLRSLLLLTISLLFLVPATKAADDKPFDRIISNIIRQELKGINSNSVSAKARSYLRARQGDGSFPDIDYASRSQTNWAPITHLDRTKVMVLAYVDPAGPLYGDKALYAAIVDALDYWHAADPVSTNWYMWEIAWPQRMGVILSLMRAGEKQVPAEVETKILAQMRAISKGPAQPGSQGSGANKMDIALQWIYRAALQRDKEALDFAVEQFYRPMTFNIHEGLQSDYSYLQHGPQLYIGGYGASVLTAMLKVAFYVVGTEYTGGKSIDLISRFVRRAYMPAVRGRYMLYGAIGRGFARKGGIDRAGFAYDLAKMQELDPAFADTYQKGIERMRGREGAGYGLEPYHCHFWRGDYTLHQRPDYTLDVRMASTRTMRCENGNGENLRGYFITEGGTAIVRRGDEYHDIFPVWDWSRLPGTTTPALAEVPRPAAWGQMGQSPFAGGVSDSLYGVTAYQMTDTTNNVHTSAKKAWFFFDNEVVCLGADIRSENAAGIGTTINQCLLNGPVHIQTRRAKAPSIHGKGKNATPTRNGYTTTASATTSPQAVTSRCGPTPSPARGTTSVAISRTTQSRRRKSSRHGSTTARGRRVPDTNTASCRPRPPSPMPGSGWTVW